MTWEELIQIEPRLRQLAERAGRRKPDARNFDTIWVNEFKKELERLVGHFADTDNCILAAAEAYQIAYIRIYREYES